MGPWRSWLARCIDIAKATGSSPVGPTNKVPHFLRDFVYLNIQPVWLWHESAVKYIIYQLKTNLGKFYRINQNIRYPEVRVLDQDGKTLGVMTSQEAQIKATEAALDLVEITDKTTPPIVKIIDFQKFKYQEDKKEKAGASKGGQETKELRLKPFMAENDIQIRVKQAEKFLKAGDRVKLVVKFQGREITKKEFGEKVMATAIGKLAAVSTVVEPPKYLGKLLIAQIKPKK